MKYSVTAPRRLQLWSLGVFEKNEARKVELSEEQVRSLKARGCEVERESPGSFFADLDDDNNETGPGDPGEGE
jgi:hypothetical protein